MQNKDIEIFLDLVQARNITKTAEHLFLAQSVVSTRLKRLEEELGYELFTRSKGVREMELTRQGREFVGIATRWKNLFEEADLLRERAQVLLRIAAPESVYYDFLEPIVVSTIHRNQALKLSKPRLKKRWFSSDPSAKLAKFNLTKEGRLARPFLYANLGC